MKKQTIVIALGGNALGKNSTDQKEAVKIVAKVIVDLKNQGHNIVVCHGNGPQVGAIQNAFSIAHKHDDSIEAMPFAECGAMSQGYIGFHLQNAIHNEITKRKLNFDCVSVVTQTLVDKDDPAFSNPTKPVGQFMSEDEAKKLAHQNNWIVKEDSGRGWRRVVPSPLPVEIMESSQIDVLMQAGSIVIAAGGGGVPVYKDGKGNLVGVDAVIDKDNTSSKLAQEVNADTFIILTAEDKIILNYGKPNQKPLNDVDTIELKEYYDQGHFPPGSMGPKVNSVINYTNKTGNPSFIGDLKYASDILNRKHGTKIYKN